MPALSLLAAAPTMLLPLVAAGTLLAIRWPARTCRPCYPSCFQSGTAPLRPDPECSGETPVPIACRESGRRPAQVPPCQTAGPRTAFPHSTRLRFRSQTLRRTQRRQRRPPQPTSGNRLRWPRPPTGPSLLYPYPSRFPHRSLEVSPIAKNLWRRHGQHLAPNSTAAAATGSDRRLRWHHGCRSDPPLRTAAPSLLPQYRSNRRRETSAPPASFTRGEAIGTKPRPAGTDAGPASGHFPSHFATNAAIGF